MCAQLRQSWRFDRLLPSTVLTMRLMDRVIDMNRVAEVHFGSGDNPDKCPWIAERWDRWSLAAFEPRALRGTLGSVRHVGESDVTCMTAKYATVGPRW